LLELLHPPKFVLLAQHKLVLNIVHDAADRGQSEPTVLSTRCPVVKSLVLLEPGHVRFGATLGHADHFYGSTARKPDGVNCARHTRLNAIAKDILDLLLLRVDVDSGPAGQVDWQPT
jgi:hypothetical protein